MTQTDRQPEARHGAETVQARQATLEARTLPSCDCGNPDAYWHGDAHGLRMFVCDQCWKEEVAS
jgi:hypothetical protein